MTRNRLFQIAAFAVILVFSVCAQPALAQSTHHLTARAVTPQWFNQSPAVTPALFQLVTGMGVLPPVDGGGNDEWPCFPNPANANYPDCSTIAAGGVVVGGPAYTWPLANCDASAAGAPNCGQIYWFYEDDTGDNTSHLVVSITAKQGANYVLNTGNFDFGPNPFPAGSVIVISDDTAFGTLGATGKNNGFCAGSNKVCADPVAGVVNLVTTTKIGAQKITGKFNIALK